jgi:ribosomal protein L29
MSKKEIQIFARQVEVPEFLENDSQDLVWWGKDNLIPQWLNYLYYTSAVHQGIINGKVNFVVGGGIQGNDELVRMFDPILKYISADIEISNSAYVKAIFDPSGQIIGKVKHIPFEWVRVTKSGKYQVSEDWTNSQFKPITYVSINDRTDEMVCIIPFKEHGRQYKLDPNKRKVSLNYYPQIPYSGSIKSIMTDIEIKNYEFSEVVNNFSLGTVLSLNNGASPNEEDRNKVKDYIIDSATGSDNAGGVMVVFNNGKDTEPTVLHLNGNQLHERYLSLGESVQNNILKGHGVVSGELFGFTRDGNFNQSNLDIAFHLMNQTYFKMRRNQILSIIDAVADINGIVNDVTFEEFAMPTAKVETPRFKLSEENKDDDIIQAFANCGRERTGKEDVILFGNFDEDLFKKNFAELNETAQRVLQLISEETPFDAVMEATETRATELAKIYQRLTDLGLIEIDGTITQSGKIQVARQDIARIETVYSYEVKPSYGAEVIPTTRPFCKKMIELSQTRFWTIEDINAISSRFGMDVWRYRGGWYHNPDTGKNEPSCRHYWKQNVIFR